MQRFAQTVEVLGTKVEVVVYAGGASEASALFEDAFEECFRVEKLYSRFEKGNYLDALNSLVGEKIQVSLEVYELLKFGREMFEITDGAFDLRVKKSLENLGYDAEYSFQKRLMEGETLNSENSGIELFENNFVKIDAEVELGGLGKGYILDLVKDQFKEVQNFMINAGGDIYAKGRDLEIGAWKVVFENPLNEEEGIGVVEVDDFFLASSNAQKRAWEGGHHLIDPRTGNPANEMLAVYVQAERGIVADSYSTALFVMGFEKARNFLQGIADLVAAKSLPVQTLEAMLISPRGEMFRSKGFSGELFG